MASPRSRLDSGRAHPVPSFLWPALCWPCRVERLQAQRAVAVAHSRLRPGQSGVTRLPVWRSWVPDMFLSLLAFAVCPWPAVTCFFDLWSQPHFSAAVPPSLPPSGWMSWNDPLLPVPALSGCSPELPVSHQPRPRCRISACRDPCLAQPPMVSVSAWAFLDPLACLPPPPPLRSCWVFRRPPAKKPDSSLGPELQAVLQS